MSIELNDNQIQQIISLLGYKQKENKEIYLTETEIESLYKLMKSAKNKDSRFKIKNEPGGGIGIKTTVIVDQQEIDITDYDSW
jgi:hypothetical protein